MEAMHVCPHCGGTLDAVGEQMVKEEEVVQRRERRKRDVAKGRLKQYEANHWYTRRHNLISALFGLLGVMPVWLWLIHINGELKASEYWVGYGIIIYGTIVCVVLTMVAMAQMDAHMRKRFREAFAKTFPKYWDDMGDARRVSIPRAFV